MGSKCVNAMQPTHFSSFATVRLATIAVVVSSALHAQSAQSRAYVTNSASNSVSIVDINTRAVVGTVDVGSRPIGLALHPVRNRAYVAVGYGDATRTGTIQVLDTATGRLAGAGITVGPEPFGVAISPTGSRLYVANNGHGGFNTVSVLDTLRIETDPASSVVATISVGLGPTGLALNPTGSRLFVVNSNASTLSVVDTSTNLVIATVPLDGTYGAAGVVVHPSGNPVYVAAPAYGRVTVIDAASNTTTTTIDTGGRPQGISLNPAGTRLYVADNGGTTVSVFDTATRTFLKSIPVGLAPFGISLTPDGATAVVANSGENTVSIFDASSNTLISNLTVGGQPIAFGHFIAPSPSTPASVLAGPIVNAANGHHYYLLSPASWSDSESRAVQLGGHLATVRSSSENDWVMRTFGPYTSGQYNGLWIGLYDPQKNRNWVWASGETATYRNWSVNEPSDAVGGPQDYVQMFGPDDSRRGKWNDQLNESSYAIYGVVEVAPNAPGMPAPIITDVSPKSGHPGQTITGFTVAGHGFRPPIDPLGGPFLLFTSPSPFGVSDITVNSYTVNPEGTQVTATITLRADCQPGDRTLIITNSDGQQARTTFRVISPRPVIVIPGILGTTLYSSPAHELYWINPVAALVDADSFLRALSVDSLTGESVHDLKPGPIFDGSVPPSLLTNVYGNLLASLRQSGYADDHLLFTLPYDWRLDNTTAADQLHNLIEHIFATVSLPEQTTVDIVAHSMGGLIARKYAAKYGTNRLHKVIYLGTPHLGSPDSFGPLVFADDLDSFLSIPHINSATFADVARTFPSLFQLLPRTPFVFSTNRNALLSNTEVYKPAPAGFLQSSRWVGLADDFFGSLTTTLPSQQQTNIVGTGTATLKQLFVSKSDSGQKWCGISDNGDGTVPLDSATGVAAINFFVDGVKHASLPNNAAVGRLLINILNDDLATLPAGVARTPSGRRRTQEWCSGSPVRITVTDSSARMDGRAPDGSIARSIPGSDFFVFSENEGGFLPAGVPYWFNISATSIGVFSLTITERDEEGNGGQKVVFTNVPVAANSRATVGLGGGSTVPVMVLDIGGDGGAGVTITANQAVPPTVALLLLVAVVKTLHVESGIQTSYLAKIDAASKAVAEGNKAAAKNVLNSLINEVGAQSGRKVPSGEAHGVVEIITAVIGTL